ncbi:YphA family membrane protein [Paenibacillus eucommiae]|uniref:Uncharacterized protein n=1 Tax=Paenibacillus eucommiae TaxID=1355755 RepID=A0ABS4IN25_9BACL|nr:hypothetical protein [Paenibacillus eucommiae]MBP1988910.1 hypothetical protein [Paenibacillus eucommiae]
MNPGYLSLVLLSITLILFASGWKEIYVRSISQNRILLFFIGWILLFSFEIKLPAVQINWVFAGISVLSLGIIIQTKGLFRKLHLLSIGLLLGSFHVLAMEILAMDPMMAVVSPQLDAVLFLVCVVLLLERRLWEQIASLSLGIIIGEIYSVLAHSMHQPLYFGGASFQDGWWLSVFAARTFTLLLESLVKGFKAVCKALIAWKGGWRK